MGQSRPLRPIALVVEDDLDQRELVAALLEETELDVIECESAEAALAVIRAKGDQVAMVFTDIRLSGRMDGVELATITNSDYPHIAVVVTSGNPGNRLRDMPANAVYLAKPWLALDILRIAEHARA